MSLRSRSSSARSVSDRSLSGTHPSSFAFFTHLPNVISWTPILLATSVIDRPESRCRLTACSLYSWVKLRRVATRFPPLAISGSHNRCLQDRVRSRVRWAQPGQDSLGLGTGAVTASPQPAPCSAGSGGQFDRYVPTPVPCPGQPWTVDSSSSSSVGIEASTAFVHTSRNRHQRALSEQAPTVCQRVTCRDPVRGHGKVPADGQV